MILPLENLVNALTKLPTIGKKSAWRLALHLIEQKNEEVVHLAQCLTDLKEKVLICKRCFNYSESEICSICSSQSRNQEIICIVERPLDLLNNSKGQEVLVTLKGNQQFVGTLLAFDIHINLVLENVKEMENNEIKRNLGLTFLRGDTIIFISPASTALKKE